MTIKAYYKFTNNLQDENNPLNDLSLTGTPLTFTDGALTGFSNGNSAVSNVRLLTDFIPNTSYTIEMWIKFATGPDQQEAFGIYAGGQTAISVRVTNFGTPDMYLNLIAVNNQFTSMNINSLMNDGLFHHLAIVSDGTQFKSFIDGVAIVGGGNPYNQGSTHLPTVYPGASGRIFVGSGGFGGAVDDVKITDTADYSANFTPTARSGGAVVPSSNKVKAKVTVGGKLILSLDSSPVTDGGVNAPIGSQALVKIGVEGSTWIKSGPNPIDWLRVATGISEDGWNMVYNPADLDAPVADAFFGTSGSAFDGKISFFRHGNHIMTMNTDNSVVVNRPFTFSTETYTHATYIANATIGFHRDNGSNDSSIVRANRVLQIRAGEANDLDLSGGSIFMFTDNDVDGEFQKTFSYPGLNLQPTIVEAGKPFTALQIDNMNTTFDIARVYNTPVEQGSGVNLMSELFSTVMIKGTVNGETVHMIQKINCHCVANQIVSQQDSFYNETEVTTRPYMRVTVSQNQDVFSYIVKTLINGVVVENPLVVIFQEEKQV